MKKSYLETVNLLPASFEKSDNSCRDQLNYIPDPEALEQTPIKYIKVNFHIICDAQGRGNFNKADGTRFIYEVVKSANDKLSRNKKMNLPPGNDTPLVPMRYRYELTGHPNDPNDNGIYFHYDDEHYFMVSKGKNKNQHSKKVFEKYGIQKDTVLNIFVQNHHLDSIQSPTYRKSIKGIGYPGFVKLNHWYHDVVDTTYANGKPVVKWNKWNAIKNLNHEIGHSIGLRHTWRGNDGCDDTPTHPNCWNRTKGKSPCDVNWSNNVMDYNAHSSAWSPCQIGICHRNFSDKRKTIRKLLVKNWCTLDESKTISIDKDTHWLGARDLEGNLIIRDTATLTIHCRTALPKNGKIIIHPKAKLILNGATLENDCGDTWKGIEIWTSKKERGQVELFNNAKILHVENEIKSIVEE